MGSIIDNAVSSSDASEHEKTSRLCKLHDKGLLFTEGRYDNTAVLFETKIRTIRNQVCSIYIIYMIVLPLMIRKYLL